MIPANVRVRCPNLVIPEYDKNNLGDMLKLSEYLITEFYNCAIVNDKLNDAVDVVHPDK